MLCGRNPPMAHDPEPTHAPPHYLRFARAIALVGALGGSTAGCCPVIPDTVACNHCTCPGQTASASQPLSCSTIHRDAQCCVRALPVPGPLAPPSLPTS
ncbi:MAG: hypothetical protein U0234_30670 [Sandaracinus sp.]